MLLQIYLPTCTILHKSINMSSARYLRLVVLLSS